MKRRLLALATLGIITSAIVNLGLPESARANITDSAADACRGTLVSNDWKVGADCRGLLDVWKDTLTQIAGGGASYMEECVMEGCSREEVKEMHGSYREEMIKESGGSYGEIVEVAVGIWQSRLNAQSEALLVLAMFDEFHRYGWSIRTEDVRTAQLRSMN